VSKVVSAMFDTLHAVSAEEAKPIYQRSWPALSARSSHISRFWKASMTAGQLGIESDEIAVSDCLSTGKESGCRSNLMSVPRISMLAFETRPGSARTIAKEIVLSN
jgi:hypothetical protein